MATLVVNNGDPIDMEAGDQDSVYDLLVRAQETHWDDTTFIDNLLVNGETVEKLDEATLKAIPAEDVHLEVTVSVKPQRSEEDIIAEKYRGIRPAHGYPACPDHTEKETLFKLLQATDRAGVELTESFAMMPAASVSGLYFAHPDARYFALDRITKDQV